MSAPGLQNAEAAPQPDQDPQVMVALYPPRALAEGLALPGGEAASDLHVTVAYLGRRSSLPVDPAELVPELRKVVAAAQPLRGSLGGIVRFPASDGSEGREPFCAVADLPGLVELREQLRQALERRAVQLPALHGYVPHLCLAYLDPGAPAPLQQIPARPVRFTEVALVMGAQRWALPLAPDRAAMKERRPRHCFSLDLLDPRIRDAAGGPLPSVLPPPRVGVWDQVLKFGIYEKDSIDGDGDEKLLTVFDETTCNQMLDHFAAQENDFFLDAGHSILDGGGEALCYHNALVLVVDGQVKRLVSRDPALAPPTLDELRRPGGGTPSSGIYAHRSMLTSLGMDPRKGLSVYRYVSPFYAVTPSGYRLINATATNIPYLQGVALAMEDRRKERSMSTTDTQQPQQPGAQAQENAAAMKAIMEAAGVKDEDTPEQKVMKMAAYMQKMTAPPAAAPPRAAGMQEVSVAAPAEVPAGAAPAQPPAGGAPTIAVPGQPGLQPATSPLTGGQGGNYMTAMDDMRRTLTVQQQQILDMQAAQKQRQELDRKATALQFAMDAQRRGRVKTRHTETHAQARERIAKRFLESGEAAAMDALDDEGANAVPEDLLTSFSQNGTPLGGGFQGGSAAMEDPGAEIARLAAARVKAEGKEGQRGAFSVAAKAVARERQDLASGWAGGRGVYPFGFAK